MAKKKKKKKKKKRQSNSRRVRRNKKTIQQNYFKKVTSLYGSADPGATGTGDALSLDAPLPSCPDPPRPNALSAAAPATTAPPTPTAAERIMSFFKTFWKIEGSF
jgi:hypothetical protein